MSAISDDKTISDHIQKLGEHFNWNLQALMEAIQKDQQKLAAQPTGEAASPRSAEAQITDDEANILVGACGILDVIKGEWKDSWTDYDQNVRDGLSKMLQSYYAKRDAALPGQPSPAPEYCQCRIINANQITDGECLICGKPPRSSQPSEGPRCPKCGKNTLELHSSNIFDVYVECHNDQEGCDFDLATNDLADFAQFFRVEPSEGPDLRKIAQEIANGFPGSEDDRERWEAWIYSVFHSHEMVRT